MSAKPEGLGMRTRASRAEIKIESGTGKDAKAAKKAKTRVHLAERHHPVFLLGVLGGSLFLPPGILA